MDSLLEKFENLKEYFSHANLTLVNLYMSKNYISFTFDRPRYSSVNLLPMINRYGMEIISKHINSFPNGLTVISESYRTDSNHVLNLTWRIQ